jgi:hypothetical protein
MGWIVGSFPERERENFNRFYFIKFLVMRLSFIAHPLSSWSIVSPA